MSHNCACSILKKSRSIELTCMQSSSAACRVLMEAFPALRIMTSTSTSAPLRVVAICTLQLADLEIHNLVTSPLFAWACWLRLGSLMVRQLWGHLGIALFQQPLEIIKGLCVLQMQPEASDIKPHMLPHSSKIILTAVYMQDHCTSKILVHCRQVSGRLSRCRQRQGACFEDRAALPAG